MVGGRDQKARTEPSRVPSWRQVLVRWAKREEELDGEEVSQGAL